MGAERFRTQDTIVNEEGEFAAPVRLQSVEYESMIDTDSVQPEDDFVFDEETAWDQPLVPAPVKQHPQPVSVGGKSSNKRRKKRSGGWKAYAYVLVICLSLAGILVLGVMMMPQLAGYFWRDFDNFAFINGELLRYNPQTVTQQ